MTYELLTYFWYWLTNDSALREVVNTGIWTFILKAHVHHEHYKIWYKVFLILLHIKVLEQLVHLQFLSHNFRVAFSIILFYSTLQDLEQRVHLQSFSYFATYKSFGATCTFTIFVTWFQSSIRNRLILLHITRFGTTCPFKFFFMWIWNLMWPLLSKT